jgi:hypothetical protein
MAEEPSAPLPTFAHVTPESSGICVITDCHGNFSELPRSLDGASVEGISDVFFARCARRGTRIPDFVTFICGRSTPKDSQFLFFGSPSAVIPASVTQIRSDAFSHFTDLETVAFAPDARIVSISGFSHCPRLSAIAFSSTLPLQTVSGFRRCPALRRIEILPSVKEVTGFSNCKLLTEVMFCEGSTLLSVQGFDSCLSLSRITFPASLQSIRNKSFCGCPILSEFLFPIGAQVVSISALNNCSRLSRLAIPPSVKVIRGVNECRSLRI